MALIFDAPYDWGSVLVGENQSKSIGWSSDEVGDISDVVLSVTAVDDPSWTYQINSSIDVEVIPTASYISDDVVQFQNLDYPQYEGDTSNQVTVDSMTTVINDYAETALYVFKMEVGEPTSKSASISVRAEYTLTVPGDPLAVPPTSEVVTQEVATAVYSIVEEKNLDSLNAQLEQLVEITNENQGK